MHGAGATERHGAAELRAVMPNTSRNTHKRGVSPSISTVRSTPFTLIVVAIGSGPILTRRTQIRHSGAPPRGEPGTHFPEAGVHRFRAPPFGRPRNDRCSIQGIAGGEQTPELHY